MSSPLQNTFGLAGIALALAALAGCASPGPAPLRGGDRAEAFASEQDRRRPSTSTPTALDNPALVINGVVYGLDDIAPRLAESAGDTIVRELALEHALDLATRQRGITVTPEQIEAERRRLERAIAAAADIERQDQLQQVIQDARAARGLGPERFEALARRTATLRALVRDDVTISREALQLEYELTYGPRVQASVITTGNATEAQRVRDELSSQNTFARLAALRSTDPSAERGGVIEPVSPVDPAYPVAFRRALAEVLDTPPAPTLPETDRVRGPIALETGDWLLLLPDAVLYPGEQPPFDVVRAELETSLRERQERLRMTQLAQQLLGGTIIRVEHPALRWAWDASNAN